MSRIFKKHTLSVAVLSALSCSVSATPFDNNNEKSTEETEVIEVRGMRGSVASSQEIKRLSDTVKDVITAKDIGALPDKSVTETLQRVPGVTIERFESTTDSNHFSSEGTGVVVRGLKRIRSEINGRDSFSSNSYGGGLSYADIPGELLGRIEVVKNTTADLVAGGVAGTVNLVTRKPFDSQDMIVYGQLKGTYGDHREEVTPAATLMFSNVWETENGRFGFLIGGTDSTYKDRGDGIGVESYYERSSTARETEHFGAFGTAIPGMEDRTVFTPAGVAIRSSDSDRTRTGLVTSAQWENTEKNLKVMAEYIFSDAARERDERVVQYAEQGFRVNPNNIGFVNGTFDDEGFMTAGEVNTNWLTNASRFNKVKTRIEDYSLHVDYSPTDYLDLAFDYQHVDSSNSVVDWTYSSVMLPTMASWYNFDGETNRPATQIINTGVEFDLSGDLPRGIHYTGEPANPMFNEQAFMRSKMDHEEDNEADLDAFSFDLEYHIEDSWITSVKAGAYASKKTQLSRNSDWNWGEVGGAWSNSFETSYLKHPELYESYTFKQNEFFGGGHLKSDQTFLFPRFADVHNFRNFGESIRDISAGAPDLDERANTVDGYLDSEMTETSEERLELYVQANYEFFDLTYPIKGNFGLRYVSWQVESDGAIRFPAPFGWDPQGTAATIAEFYPYENAYANGAEGARSFIKGDRYSKLLPSFNISMELNEDLIVRFATSQNIYLPTFSNFQNFKNIFSSRVYDYNVAPGELDVTSVSFSGQTGNPNIEPEEALNMDLSLEWYFSEAGSTTLSIFRKELDNIIRKRLFTENVTNPEPFNGEDNTMPVDFQTDTNEGSGTITGFEIAYTQFFDFLPGAWSGLGLSANYTFISQSDVEDKKGFGEGSAGAGGRNSYRAFKNLDLPGYSDDTVNLALMYEKDDVAARLAYSWRSDYLLTRRDADQFAPVIAKATGQLDGSISYKINDDVKVGFEATNLLDEVIETELMYEQNGRQTPRNHFKTDRRFGAYVTVSF
ncbi:MAG: TonB-dependent receptor [Lentisphaeria bacterium]|nr:TonB-dependent receptor [Lentisphaeria bacterium]